VNTGGSEHSAAGLGRLLPLQTLCLCCEAPDAHTVLIARALLRRSPEAREHPLPRVLRRSARGRKYTVFVCTAATVLRHRRLAAEEAGEDAAVLRELQEVLGNADATSSPASQTPPSGVPPLVMPPAVVPTSPTPGPGSSGREGAVSPGSFAAPPPRPPANPPPPRRSPRRAPQARHWPGAASTACRPADAQQREAHRGAAARPERAGDCEHTAAASSPPRTLCQALVARAARGLPPLGMSPALGATSPQRMEELRLRGCSTVRWAGAAALPAIRAQ